MSGMSQLEPFFPDKLQTEYQYIKDISSGSFGRVAMAYHVPSQTKVAVKKQYLPSNQPALTNTLVRETEAHLFLRHVPFVSQLIDIIPFPSVDGVGCTYCVYQLHVKDLSDVVVESLKNIGLTRRSSTEKGIAIADLQGSPVYSISRDSWEYVKYITGPVLRYMFETLCGVANLHAFSIVHRDIKPNNIMISKEGRVSIIDLGFARDISSYHQSELTQNVMTRTYAAPEVLSNMPGYGKKTDVWSLGCTFYQMLFGRSCFDSLNPFQRHCNQSNPTPSLNSTQLESILTALPLPVSKRELTQRILAVRYPNQNSGALYNQLVASPQTTGTISSLPDLMDLQERSLGLQVLDPTFSSQMMALHKSFGSPPPVFSNPEGLDASSIADLCSFRAAYSLMRGMIISMLQIDPDARPTVPMLITQSGLFTGFFSRLPEYLVSSPRPFRWLMFTSPRSGGGRVATDAYLAYHHCVQSRMFRPNLRCACVSECEALMAEYGWFFPSSPPHSIPRLQRQDTSELQKLIEQTLIACNKASQRWNAAQLDPLISHGEKDELARLHRDAQRALAAAQAHLSNPSSQLDHELLAHHGIDICADLSSTEPQLARLGLERALEKICSSHAISRLEPESEYRESLYSTAKRYFNSMDFFISRSTMTRLAANVHVITMNQRTVFVASPFVSLKQATRIKSSSGASFCPWYILPVDIVDESCEQDKKSSSYKNDGTMEDGNRSTSSKNAHLIDNSPGLFNANRWLNFEGDRESSENAISSLCENLPILSQTQVGIQVQTEGQTTLKSPRPSLALLPLGTKVYAREITQRKVLDANPVVCVAASNKSETSPGWDWRVYDTNSTRVSIKSTTVRPGVFAYCSELSKKLGETHEFVVPDRLLENAPQHESLSSVNGSAYSSTSTSPLTITTMGLSMGQTAVTIQSVLFYDQNSRANAVPTSPTADPSDGALTPRLCFVSYGIMALTRLTPDPVKVYILRMSVSPHRKTTGHLREALSQWAFGVRQQRTSTGALSSARIATAFPQVLALEENCIRAAETIVQLLEWEIAGMSCIQTSTTQGGLMIQLPTVIEENAKVSLEHLFTTLIETKVLFTYSFETWFIRKTARYNSQSVGMFQASHMFLATKQAI